MEGGGKVKIKDYISLLKRNKLYRWLVLGEMINYAGGWLTYVAMVKVGEKMTGGPGFMVSAILALQRVPSMISFPFSGVLADSYDRGRVLVCAHRFGAAVVLLYPLAEYTGQIWLLYTVILAQFTISSFVSPARDSIAQSIMDPGDIHLQATIDSIMWGVMCTLGASIGGFVVAAVGTTPCFLVDSLTFLVGSWVCGYLVGVPRRNPTSAPNLGDVDHEKHLVPQLDMISSSPINSFAVTPWHLDMTSKPSRWRLGCFEQYAKEFSSTFKRGIQYVGAKKNRHIAVVMTVKAAGAFLWGVADVSYIKLSEVKSMQIFGSSAATMGVMFSFSALGSIIGPIGFNLFISPVPRPLLQGVTLSFFLVAFSFTLIDMHLSLSTVLLSATIRAIGAEVLWAYSTILMEYEVDSAVMGRVSSLERFFANAFESMSNLLAGIFEDMTHAPFVHLFRLIGILGYALTFQYAMFCRAYAGSFKHQGKTTT